LEKSLSFTSLSRGTAWLDTGSPESLSEAANFIKIIETRTGLKIGCLEEIAWRNHWISGAQLSALSKAFRGNDYGLYLEKLLEKSS
jgi:glucose-1-phosphate thymidylyltransferase